MALAAAAALAAAHVLAGRLRFLDTVPRHWLLSGFGGISVAYVFVHLLPEVAQSQEYLGRASAGGLALLERHAYLLALAGLLAFFGIELATRRSREPGEAATLPAFLLGTLGFTLYNAVIGMLLVRTAAERGGGGLAWFTLAVGVHFVVNDFGLRAHHRQRYHRVGRWLLSAAVLAGWGVATLVRVPQGVVALLVSFLAGGIVLNVLKEELPSERRTRFTPLVLGAAGYTALLLVV